MRHAQARKSAVVLTLTSLLISCQPAGQGADAIARLQPPGGARPAGAPATCTGTPPPPTNVAAVASAPNVVTLTWDDGTPAYVVYRSTVSGGPYTAVGSTDGGVVTFDDTTVSGGSTYFYVVRGLDCDESLDSEEATATATGDCTLPPSFAGIETTTNAQASTCTVDLSWSSATPACGGTITYDVHRSRTPGFAPGVATRIATGVAGTSFSDAVNLASATAYSYVVRAVEVGDRIVGEENTVERSTAPTGSITPVLSYFDDFGGNRPPNAAAYWTTFGTPDLLSLVAGCHWQSANTSYKFGAPGVCGGTYQNNANSDLVLGGDGSVDPAINGFAVPVGSAGTLSFRHWFNFESRFDGATLYYSTTGAGGPWALVDDVPSAGAPYISAGGYNNTLTTGVKGWTNTSTEANGALRQVTVTLDPLAGQTVWFEIHFRTDSSVVREGHYLDDVRIDAIDVAACTTATTPPGPAASFAVALAPSAVAGASIPFTATALDAWEQPAVGFDGTADVSSTDPQAVVTSPITFSGGVAGGDVAFGTAGAQSITATDVVSPGVVGAAPVQVAPGAPRALSVDTQPTATVAGVAISPAVVVAVVDAYGNVVPSATDDVTLTIDANPGGGTLLGTTTRDAAGGFAIFPGLSIAEAGAGYTLAAASGVLTSAASAPFDILPDVPVTIAFTAQPASAQAGVAIAPAIQVGFFDQFGNVSPIDASVTLLLESNPGSSWLAGTTTAAAVDGVATFADLWLNQVGTGYTLLAGSPSFASVASDPFDVAPGVPYAVEVATHPTDTVAGAPFSPPVTGTVFDRYGNVATQYSGTVQATLLGGAGASLLGTSSVAASAGVASFSDLAVDKAGTGYALGLAAPGLLMGTSSAFDVAAGPATRLALVAPPASATAGIEVTFQVRALDAVGNVAPDYVGTATVTSSDAAITAPADVAFVAGVAEVPATFNTTGLQTLTITDAVEPTFTVTADVVVTAFPQPTVAITSPLDGEALTGVVTITAVGAVASGTTLSGIAIRVDGVELASGSALPFDALWDTGGLSGPHVLTAVVSDAAGNVVQSNPVIVTVPRPEDPSEGGCSCGTGTGAEASLLFGLAGLILRRRRKDA